MQCCDVVILCEIIITNQLINMPTPSYTHHAHLQEHGRLHAPKWNKPNEERQILGDLTYM